jgi:cellulose synthase operon protein C
VKLAELEAASNHRDSARARLLKVVGIDPSYLAAKRLLFLLDRRG